MSTFFNYAEHIDAEHRRQQEKRARIVARNKALGIYKKPIYADTKEDAMLRGESVKNTKN